ncbi:MAG: TetR/AcrR family transcriptional regulator [Phycisphaerales bacterium]|nr:TetR/AcrR family transcriptional regulator [Phycisphaerales bacterium]
MAAEIDTSKREQIRRAAVRLFCQQGYRATSVRDIADAVGLQGGSLYAHVTSKDDLLWEVVNVSADGFFAALRPIVESDRTTVKKLREAIIAHVGVIAEDLEAAAIYSTEWRHLSDGRRREFAARRDEYEAMFRGLIRDGIRQGFLAPTDETFATLFALSALNWLYQWYKPDGRLTADDLGKLMADYIFDGLRRRTT